MDALEKFALSSEQIRVISRILADMGQICIASTVVPLIIPEFRMESLLTLISGLIFALFFWSLSVLFVKNL